MRLSRPPNAATLCGPPPMAGAAQPPALELCDIGWAPPSRPEVLSGISVTVPQGKVLAICGPNGSGKSSLLRLIYRHTRPTRGEIRVLGRPLAQIPAGEAARLIAAVLQEQPTDSGLTARQIVTLGRLPHRRGWGTLGGQTEAARVQAALDRMELTLLADRSLATLSGGERQRVAFARALAQEPRILLLDEPTNHLDIRHQLELLTLLRGLGLTVVVTLHDLGLAAEFADRVLLLHQGRVLAEGPPTRALCPEHLATAFGIRASVDRSGPHPRFSFHLP